MFLGSVNAQEGRHNTRRRAYHYETIPTMTGPRPDGWKGGSDDYEIVRTLDGHLPTMWNMDPASAVNIDFLRNDRGPGRRDLGGIYSPTGESESQENESLLEP